MGFWNVLDSNGPSDVYEDLLPFRDNLPEQTTCVEERKDTNTGAEGE